MIVSIIIVVLVLVFLIMLFMLYSPSAAAPPPTTLKAQGDTKEPNLEDGRVVDCPDMLTADEHFKNGELMILHMKGCGHCNKMKAECKEDSTFVQSLGDRMNAVFVESNVLKSATGDESALMKAVKAVKMNAVPTLMVFDSENNQVYHASGAVDPKTETFDMWMSKAKKTKLA